MRSMSGLVPDEQLKRRLDKAMEIVHFMDERERVLLLAAVVAPQSSEWQRLLEEEEAA